MTPNDVFLSFLGVEEVLYLLSWDGDVDGFEVMAQVMAHKDAATVHQVA